MKPKHNKFYGIILKTISEIMNFKIFVILSLVFLSASKLLATGYVPILKVLSDRDFLTIMLVLVVYLWIKEIIDKRELSGLNIDLKKAHERLKKSNLDIVFALFLAEDAKDKYTKGHCRRVTKYAILIGETLGLGQKDLEIIERAGLLHDLGKININNEILHKPGKLTEKEWEIIKKHPLDGAKMLRTLDFLKDELLIIQHHHERYDGTGYPDGLKSDQIPLGSRILAVADAFDAMNSKRSYRLPLRKEDIINELKKSKNSQLDSKIVDTFLNILNCCPAFSRPEDCISIAYHFLHEQKKEISIEQPSMYLPKDI